MKREDIDRIEALLASATPGPWMVDADAYYHRITQGVAGKRRLATVTPGGTHEEESSNASLMAESRNLARLALEAVAAVKAAYREGWIDGHHQGVGCGHPMNSCPHYANDYATDEQFEYSDAAAFIARLENTDDAR